MQSRSGPGRERAVEHILTEVSGAVLALSAPAHVQDYVKALITVFDQAEDLESLDDLHTLCGITQTISALLAMSGARLADFQSCSTITASSSTFSTTTSLKV
jgi:hypothetical protein